MVFFEVGLCSRVFYSDLPEGSRITTFSSLLLFLSGTGFMHQVSGTRRLRRQLTVEAE